MSKDNVMFNSMDSDIVDAFIKIGCFHTVSVFFDEGKTSFDSSSKRFQFFIHLSWAWEAKRMTYKMLEPGRIGKLELRNRIAMAPMGSCLGGVKGEVTKRLIDWYTERAKGGAGLICVEDTLVTPPDKYGMEIAGQLRIHDYNWIPGWNELTESVHNYGAKISCQLNYPAAGINPNLMPGVRGGTPSPFSYTGMFGAILTREVSIDEIQNFIKAYGEGALRAKIAGFDAIELLAYHSGIACFLSPYTNKRTDLYGGSFDGRMRFAIEILQEIKKKVDDDFPIIVRMPADEFVPGGITIEEARKVAKRFEECGVHAISLSSGTYETSVSLGFGASWPCYQEKGFLEPYAAEIKEVVNIPVILAGALHFVEIAERILKERRADFIAMGRGLIADPELPKKLVEGRPEDIRRCIRCNECVSRVIAYLPISCTINAAAGMEERYRIRKTKKVKKVLIVGGGPGGMEAARVATLRGHDVFLFEKRGSLGGNLMPASAPDFKEELKYLVEWFTVQLDKLGVNIERGKEVTKEVALKMEPDVLIIATGAIAVAPDIPGIEKAVSVIDVLLGKIEVGDRVVIAGGGLVGCEAALYLVEKGKEVNILEMMGDILLESNPITKAALTEKLMEKGIRWLTNMKLEEVTGDGAIAVDKGWDKHSFQGDVVLALGLVSEISLFELLKDEISEIYTIGDCVEPRKIKQAIHEAFHIAKQI